MLTIYSVSVFGEIGYDRSAIVNNSQTNCELHIKLPQSYALIVGAFECLWVLIVDFVQSGFEPTHTATMRYISTHCAIFALIIWEVVGNRICWCIFEVNFHRLLWRHQCRMSVINYGVNRIITEPMPDYTHNFGTYLKIQTSRVQKHLTSLMSSVWDDLLFASQH